MKTRKPFLLRIDPGLHEALEEWAQHELRSLNGQIEYILKEALAKRRRSLKQEAGGSQGSSPNSPNKGISY